MEELIKIEERNGQKAVNARELHQALGFDKSHWKRWYEKNIVSNEYAEEGVDYETFAIMANGNETKDFALSLDFAKELCMLARSEAGKKVRQYFIVMERKARQALPQSFSEALRMLADATDRANAQQKALDQQTLVISDMTNQMAVMKEKVSYTDRILASKDTVVVTAIAQDYGMSAKAFNIILRDIGIQHKVNRQWILYSKYISEGYVHSSTFTFTHTDGSTGTRQTTEWTQKGRLFLYEELKKRDIYPKIEQPNKAN